MCPRRPLGARSLADGAPAFPPLQHARRCYASDAGPKGGAGALPLLAAGAAAAGAGYYYYYYSTSASSRASPSAAAPAKPAFTGGDQGFVSLKLAEVESVNHNTKRFRFELPEPDMVSGLPVASAVLTKYKGPADEKATLRPYTPVSDEAAPGFLDLVVKHYPGGPMSSHLHAMAPGQRLDVKGPLPKYAWTENKHAHVGLIAGGTGITPMYQLLRAILANPNDGTKVTLVYGSVSPDDILLHRELAALENTHPQRFRAFYVVDKAPDGWAGGQTGFISKDLLKTVLPEPKSDDIKLFVCGPPGLMKAISGNKVSPKDQGELTGALQELGYAKDQVYKF